MIDQTMIPPEVAEAAKRFLSDRVAWTTADEARFAIAAALAAWPGGGTSGSDPLTKPAYLILPLTENSHDP